MNALYGGPLAPTARRMTVSMDYNAPGQNMGC
jgi:hypothetical protein